MICLSTKARYATRLMVRLAVENLPVPIPAQELARSEGLSEDYTEQILGKLKAAGLVESRRGSRGGFRLACDTQNTTVLSILETVDGPTCLTSCLKGTCERAATCATRPVWLAANEALESVFGGATLAALAAESRRLNSPGPLDYQI